MSCVLQEKEAAADDEQRLTGSGGQGVVGRQGDVHRRERQCKAAHLSRQHNATTCDPG